MRPIEVKNREGWVERQGFDAGAPGLVIVVDDDDWSLVHERSGLRMCCSRNPEALGAIVKRVADLAEWTSSGDALRAALNATFFTIVADVPGVRIAGSEPSPDALQR